MRFGVVVPVKPPKIAKSRLSGWGDEARSELAAAFVADTVEAVIAAELVELVLAITDDHLLADRLRRLGAEVIPDVGVGDLNGSLVQGAAEVGRRAGALRPAAVCADLPALRPAELDRALEHSLAHDLAFVADADGIGTTVLSAVSLARFTPAFGPGSRMAHLAQAAAEIELDGIDSVRRDVDTPQDLEDALRLGVGPRTARLTATLT